MSLFCFVFTTEPEAKHPRAKDIAGAYAEVWVTAARSSDAERRARHYVSEHLWTVTAVTHAFECQQWRLNDLRASAAATAREALQRGNAAIFRAWPKPPKPRVYEIRPRG